MLDIADKENPPASWGREKEGSHAASLQSAGPGAARTSVRSALFATHDCLSQEQGALHTVNPSWNTVHSLWQLVFLSSSGFLNGFNELLQRQRNTITKWSTLNIWWTPLECVFMECVKTHRKIFKWYKNIWSLFPLAEHTAPGHLNVPTAEGVRAALHGSAVVNSLDERWSEDEDCTESAGGQRRSRIWISSPSDWLAAVTWPPVRGADWSSRRGQGRHV